VSAEEGAIYDAVLTSWLGPKHDNQFVNQRLGPAPFASAPEYADCVEGAHFAPDSSNAPKDKTLDASVFHPANIELIDGEKWRATDPGELIRRGVPVDAAVKEGTARSLITFSQVRFSLDRKDALVTFSNLCGRLCGTGFTVRMHSSGGQWKIAKRCGEYES
jgi:hypothetical protein